ncbi:MAG: amidohydrolase family protein [Sphingomonadaceae bacterium]
MRVVDCHTHIFPPEVARRRETFAALDDYFAELYGDPCVRIATAEDLLAEMDTAGVDVSVVCGFGWSDPALCSMHNDYLIDCIHRHPTRLAGLASVQPLQSERALAEAERCLAAGMKGVGELMPEGQGFRLNELHRLSPFFEYAARRGFPVMTHASEPMGHHYPGKQTVTPETIWPLVQAFPEARLILAHWGGGYPFYELMPEVRRASTNVYYDSAASTYLYDPQVFLHVGRIAGFDKLLWGSDYPVLRQARFLGKVRDLPIEEPDLLAVLGGNAARLLGI